MQYKLEKKFRLDGYDYSQAGDYFITICTKDFKPFFGKVVEGKMQLNAIGRLVNSILLTVPHHHGVVVSNKVMMPNHLHLIVEIRKERTNIARYVPTGSTFSQVEPKSLSSIVRSFKSECKKQLNLAGFTYFQWQPRFHDHIIRNELSFKRINEYIDHNPLKWESDTYFGKGQW